MHTRNAGEADLACAFELQGVKLAGTLTSSSSNAGSQQCLILCHGYQSYREGFQLPALAAALAEAGELPVHGWEACWQSLH
jgi:hypothetical protein